MGGKWKKQKSASQKRNNSAPDRTDDSDDGKGKGGKSKKTSSASIKKNNSNSAHHRNDGSDDSDSREGKSGKSKKSSSASANNNSVPDRTDDNDSDSRKGKSQKKKFSSSTRSRSTTSNSSSRNRNNGSDDSNSRKGKSGKTKKKKRSSSIDSNGRYSRGGGKNKKKNKRYLHKILRKFVLEVARIWDSAANHACLQDRVEGSETNTIRCLGCKRTSISVDEAAAPGALSFNEHRRKCSNDNHNCDYHSINISNRMDDVEAAQLDFVRSLSKIVPGIPTFSSMDI